MSINGCSQRARSCGGVRALFILITSEGKEEKRGASRYAWRPARVSYGAHPKKHITLSVLPQLRSPVLWWGSGFVAFRRVRADFFQEPKAYLFKPRPACDFYPIICHRGVMLLVLPPVDLIRMVAHVTEHSAGSVLLAQKSVNRPVAA
jgi:hypothetical protein